MKDILNQDTRIVKVLTKSINLLVVTLIVSGLLVNTNAIKMDEAACSPRPVPVAVTEGHEVLPYHVLLHRCSGTCHNTSPRVKTCVVKDSMEIELEVTKVNNEKIHMTVYNHTSCQCKCVCKNNEIPLDSYSRDCQCIGNGNPVSSGARNNDPNKQKWPTPYLIAIVGVGIFALSVLLFDAVLCVKGKGFFHSLQVCCCTDCKPGKNKNSQQDQQDSYQSCKAKCTPV